MENVLTALIVTSSNKGIEVIIEILNKVGYQQISTAKTPNEARGLAIDTEFDLYVVNSPLISNTGIKDTGELFAMQCIANPKSQVIFIIKSDVYEYMSNMVEEFGIITISKPLNLEILTKYIKVAKSTNVKLKKMYKQNQKLSKQIEDIKLVERAKFILISDLNMSETEAHKYIEREAMNTRTSRRGIAEKILKTYDW